jgi:hypothetical protein
MAKEKAKASDVEKEFTEDVRFRVYKNDGSGFDDFKQGQTITGVLVSIREHGITDKRTKQPKDIRVYSIRMEGDVMCRIGGRTILDRMFDDIMDEHGGFVVTNRRYSGPGYDFLKDRVVRLERGEDTRTSDKNPLGTYSVGVEED